MIAKRESERHKQRETISGLHPVGPNQIKCRSRYVWLAIVFYDVFWAKCGARSGSGRYMVLGHGTGWIFGQRLFGSAVRGKIIAALC